MSAISDLKNEFISNNSKWEENITTDLDYLKRNYIGSTSAWTNANTFKDLVNTVNTIMMCNGITVYKISPVSLNDMYDGNAFEASTVVSFMDGTELHVFPITLRTLY